MRAAHVWVSLSMALTAGCDPGSGQSVPPPEPDAVATTLMPFSAPMPVHPELVAYPSEEVAFIAGPQLRAGSAANPWPWFDRNAIAKGLEHGRAFPPSPANEDDYLLLNYYDQGLVQYINYHRTGDPTFETLARSVADSWWRSRWVGEGSVSPDASFAPRSASLGGLMLRALDGRPEMWPWITEYVRYQYDVWLGRRIQGGELHYGVRDGGYTLLYVAWLARAHPDPGVRDEMLRNALVAARDYYARLQYPDGSWRWRENPGDGSIPHEQPFMIGMLMEALVAVHQLTGDDRVRLSILAGVEHLYARGYRTDRFQALGGGGWRGMWYFIYGDRCDPPVAGPCGEGEPMPYEDIIREVRQLNPLVLHAFGYAYLLTGEEKFRVAGDEIFAATFGRGLGPGADRWYGLADFRAREYNQSYRTAGRYLAYRVGT